MKGARIIIAAILICSLFIPMQGLDLGVMETLPEISVGTRSTYYYDGDHVASSGFPTSSINSTFYFNGSRLTFINKDFFFYNCNIVFLNASPADKVIEISNNAKVLFRNSRIDAVSGGVRFAIDPGLTTYNTLQLDNTELKNLTSPAFVLKNGSIHFNEMNVDTFGNVGFEMHRGWIEVQNSNISSANIMFQVFDGWILCNNSRVTETNTSFYIENNLTLDCRRMVFSVNDYIFDASGLGERPEGLFYDCTWVDGFSSGKFRTVDDAEVTVYQKVECQVYNQDIPLDDSDVYLRDYQGGVIGVTSLNESNYCSFPPVLSFELNGGFYDYYWYDLEVWSNGYRIQSLNFYPVDLTQAYYLENGHPSFKYTSYYPSTILSDEFDNFFFNLESIVADDLYPNDSDRIDFEVVYNSAEGFVNLSISELFYDDYLSVECGVSPIVNWYGTVYFKVRATDAWGVSTDSELLSFSVLHEDAPPVLKNIPTITLTEDEPKKNVIDLREYVWDKDTSFCDLKVDILDLWSPPPGSPYLSSPVDLVLEDDCIHLSVDRLSEDFSGNYYAELSVSDQDYNRVTQQITIFVQDINDPPEINQYYSNYDLVTNEDQLGIFDISDLFVDADSQLDFFIDAPEELDVDVEKTSPSAISLKIRPQKDLFGQKNLTISATDGKDSISTELSLTVLPKNDEPTLFCEDAYKVKMGKKLMIQLLAEDPDGPTESIRFGSDRTDASGLPISDDLALYMDPSDGKFYYEPVFGDSSFIIELFATDGKETSYRTVSIVIEDINTPPSVNIVSPTKLGVSKDIRFPVHFNASSTTDPDIQSLDELKFRWSSDLQGELGVGVGITTFLKAGEHTITLSVYDGFNTVETSFKLKMVDNSEPPEPDDDDEVQENITWDPPDDHVEKQDHRGGYAFLAAVLAFGILIVLYVFISTKRSPIGQLKYVLKNKREALREEYRLREEREAARESKEASAQAIDDRPQDDLYGGNVRE